jgi:hypothetical protein
VIDNYNLSVAPEPATLDPSAIGASTLLARRRWAFMFS